MNILAIETSTSLLSVACKRADGITAEANLDGGFHHSENLILLVKQVLDTLRLKRENIDLVACGVGPGSFTGLRIGLAAVKGLALGFRKKIAGVSSLDIAAEGISIHSGDLAVILDARREMLYTAIYRFREGSPKKILKDSLLTFEELAKRVSSKTVFCGNAIDAYGERIKERFPGSHFLDKRFWNPEASSILSLIQKKKGSIKYLSLSQLKPAYMRLSEAEERRKKRN